MAIAVAAALVAPLAAGHAQPGGADASGAEVIARMRRQMLTVSADSAGVAQAAAGGHVWALLMDVGVPEGAASLLTFADGSTSLYFSTGGGVIGAGGHETVRRASAAFLDAAQGLQAGMTPAPADFPLPGDGRVRFYLRVGTDVVTAEADMEALSSRSHPLHGLFMAGIDLHQEVRLISQAGAGQN
jgi:hypothetical protein